ncbi:trp operon repressor [Ferrimonas balearica]|uniref:trp operon repressor n=1 Tax=Ferrimonas balearica TaxID=44012 RepID=UPI001C99BDB8|nr:trp operon repressor [Ferrimonas balearica]MBY5922837.1 trp operon repressor [Ferrimonas balearica]MBY5997786.1 trp operon repressor [Ferrimonas balearica]
MENVRWQSVLDLVAQPRASEDTALLFGLLLSHDERESIGGRLAVFRALLDGQMSQRQIAASLGVSIATITRASNNLKTMSEAERALLSRLIL